MINRKPKSGDVIQKRDIDNANWIYCGVVSRVDENICNMTPESETFIWKFKDTLNKLHRIKNENNRHD